MLQLPILPYYRLTTGKQVINLSIGLPNSTKLYMEIVALM